MKIRYPLSLVIFIGIFIMLQACVPPTSTEGDLSAEDWCFSKNVDDTITFYPIIKNVGATHWASEITGDYVIGAQVDSILYQSPTYTLKARPDFQLTAGESRRLPDGITVPFKGKILLINIWWFSHSEDTNNTNNENPGTSTYFSTDDFYSLLIDKQCK